MSNEYDEDEYDEDEYDEDEYDEDDMKAYQHGRPIVSRGS